MFNVRVEYESTPIRHIAVQCPKCGKWFHGWDIVKGERAFDVLRYAHDINWTEFECPVCGGFLVKRKSAYGEFFGCSNYRSKGCTYTRNITS